MTAFSKLFISAAQTAIVLKIEVKGKVISVQAVEALRVVRG
jgi:hypothetical protein